MNQLQYYNKYYKLLLILFRMNELKLSGDDEKRIGIMVASHNSDTVRFAIKKWVLQKQILELQSYVKWYYYSCGYCDEKTLELYFLRLKKYFQDFCSLFWDKN